MSPSRAQLVVIVAAVLFGATTAAAPVNTPASPPPSLPESVDGALIPNYTRLTPTIAAAGQPTLEALAKLREMGFKTVVNMRAESEPDALAGEAEAVRAQGLDYVSVPITIETFGLEAIATVERVLADPAQAPLLLHCNSSNRTGGVWAVVQARARGLSVDEALAEGQRAGLHSQKMIDAVRRVLRTPPELVND